MNVFDTSDYKVTYLLGAGASAKALPTVKATLTTEGLSESLKTFADNIKANNSVDVLHKDFIDKISDDLYWVAHNSLKFGTPDTFAKFLFLQDRQSLPRLKKALSFYFTVEQVINKRLMTELSFF